MSVWITQLLLISQVLLSSVVNSDVLLRRHARGIATGAVRQNEPYIKGPRIENIAGFEDETVAILPCEVGNRGSAWLHWFVNNTRIDLSSRSATSNTYWLGAQRYQIVKMGLKVKNIQKFAAGEYKCQLSDERGVLQEKTIPFIVYDKPFHLGKDKGELQWVDPRLESSPFLVDMDKDAVFKCHAFGGPTIHADWFVDGEAVGEGQTLLYRNIKYRNSSIGYGSHTRMVWRGAQLSDTGKKIRCVVTQTNSSGLQANLSRTFRLQVQGKGVVPPTIVNDNDKPLVAYIGTNFTYECRIVKPKLQDRLVYYAWLRYYGTIVDNVWNATTISHGPTLELTSIGKEDSGQYMCFVTNQKDDDYKLFNLTAKSKPSIYDSTFDRSRRPPLSDTNNTITVIAASFAGLITVGVIVLIVIGCMRRRKPVKHPKKRIILLAPTETYHDFMKDSSSDLVQPLMPPMVQIQGGRNRLSSEIRSYSDYEFPLDEQWEIRPRHRVQMMHLLGEGAFGCVYYAELKPSAAVDSYPVTPIAVKMLKADATDKELIDLVQELEVMKQFSEHDNIINLIGCMTRDGPLYVIVEYARHGNLRDFLRTHRPRNSYGSRMIGIPPYDDLQLTQKHLVTFSHEVSSGMEYLASNQCLHRDLAARNVLVGDDYVMKIADFGLSRNIAQQDYYKKVTEGKLPIKWMAPEALIDRKYTSKSDVWSYGILLWELFTLGGNPYPTIPHERLFESLKEGHRMDKPSHSSVDMYAIMRQCWQYHAAQRPSFSEIIEDITEILANTSDDFLEVDYSPVTTPRESTTSPCTSTTSFSGDERAPPELPPPPVGILV